LLSEFLTGPGQQVAECFAFQIKDALIETVDTNEDGDEYTSSSSTYAGGDIELIVNAYTGKGFRDQLVQAVRDYHKHSSLIGEETPEIKRVMLLGDEGRLRQILDEGLPVETMVEDQTLLKLVLMMAVTAPNWYTHLELSDTLKQSFADENEYREALKRMALELLDRGANIDTTPGPASIMTLAELLEDQTILQICRERTQSGADADALSLLVAAEKGNAASLQALVGRGARVNKRDAFRGITPLMIASQGAGGEDAPPVTGSKMLSQLEAVRYLIDQGARLDAKANNGDTAIGNAVRRGNIEIVKLLLDAGAKTDEALPRNQSLIDLAKERGHVEVLKLLQEHSGKHVGEPSTDGSNDMPLAGRFCLPFDVDAFAEYFPPEWTLVEEMDNETRTLLEGPSGDRIAVGSHQLKPSSDLFDVVGKYAGYFDENEGVEAFTSSIGTQGWSVKVRSGDKSNVMLELWGPALMSVRFVYEATSIDAATKVVLHKAVTNLIWLNGSVSCADALPVKTIKDLQHHIRAVLKDHEGLRDEILSSFADDDNVMLYPHEIEAVAEQGPSTYPLVRALVRYAIVHGIKVDVGDLCKLQSWCGAHFLNDPDLKQLLAGSAQGAAKSTRDFLEIATVARASGDCEREESLIQAALEAAKSTDDHIKLASHPLIATDPARVHSLLDAALAVATDVGDLREVLNHDLAGSDLLRLVLDRLRTSSADETFLSSVWNPLDVLILACDKSLMDRAAVEVEILALADLSPILSDAPKQATVQALPVDDETDEGNRLFQLPDMEEIHGPSGDRMHLLSLAESARDEQWSSLREMLLTRALEAATTAGRKYSAYKFLRETLQDEPRADAYLQANQADLQPFLAKKRDAEQRVQLMDAICQCALLVAAGDGRVTSEVTQELQKVRPIVEMMYRNRHAIEVLEQTEDIDKARSACGSTMLVHSLASMWLFEPAYSREISGVLSEVSTNEGRDNLYRTYATRIEDPLGRRLAVWAATEVASADGFEKGEQRALKIMAAVWGLNIHETHRWFRNFVYPVTNHSFEFIGKNLKDES
jgi:ankyrin repeat protein/tellurite resistance protein